MIRWFIGYDKDESVAAYVMAHTIQTRSSIPISITFLNRRNLDGLYTRARSSIESTDFSMSRFLIPYLCNYEGHAIFTDCDMILRDDPAKLWAWRDSRFSVQVVKHNHQPKEDKKFLNQPQTKYEMKNWSSVMIFNNEKCKALTKDFVNSASGLELHQFKWTSDDLIGELPRHWNHLVGYDQFDPCASLVHYTSGGPYFPEYENCHYADEWLKAKESMESVRET